MRTTLFLCLVSLSLADILYLDELEDMVARSDKREVERLEDDKYTPRSQKLVQRDAILARQTQSVQDQFYRTVQMKESRRAATRDYQRSQAQADGVLDVWQRLQAIDEDMSLSENEAKQQKRQLKNQMSYGERRSLSRLDSDEMD